MDWGDVMVFVVQIVAFVGEILKWIDYYQTTRAHNESIKLCS